MTAIFPKAFDYLIERFKTVPSAMSSTASAPTTLLTRSNVTVPRVRQHGLKLLCKMASDTYSYEFYEGSERYQIYLNGWTSAEGGIYLTPEEEKAYHKAFLQHGFQSTVIVRLVAQAKDRGGLVYPVLRPARELDPVFWEIVNSHGRDMQPPHLAPVFALYQAEMRLGQPINDLTKIERLIAS